MANKKLVEVEVAVTKDPDGGSAVLLQFEYGYLLLPPANADHLADTLHELAEEARKRG